MTLNEFLKLMDDDLVREWTHLKFYLYHASAITGLHAREYKEFFVEAAQGELDHVRQFMDRLWGLGFPSPTQSAASFPTYTKVEDAVAHAIELENEVVQNYTKRLEQLDELAKHSAVAAAYLKVFYEAQLQDSYEDCEHLRRLLGNDLRQELRKTRPVNTDIA